jgi:hypothetical protein
MSCPSCEWLGTTKNQKVVVFFVLDRRGQIPSTTTLAVPNFPPTLSLRPLSLFPPFV